MSKRKYTYNPQNPLYKYYENLVKENTGKNLNNWIELSDGTGLPVQTVISVARNDYDAVLRMSLGTYIKIQKTIGVDMLSFKEGEVEEKL